MMPGRWHQVAEGQLSLATGANSPGHRGDHEGSRKTIARGMPGDSGVTVVTCLRAFYFCTQGSGRIERPAFPAPSVVRGGGRWQQNSRDLRGEIAKPWLFENSNL